MFGPWRRGNIPCVRRLILSLAVACALAGLTGSVASAQSGQGVMCVLHANLTAQYVTPPTTSAAKGHTLIKVRNDGTLEFKTQINNGSGENFVAGHIHQE